jgi:transposase
MLAHALSQDAGARTSARQEIEQRLLPFQEEIRLLMSIAGIAERSAAGMLGEIGTDRSRFPSAKHASVLGRSLS